LGASIGFSSISLSKIFASAWPRSWSAASFSISLRMPSRSRPALILAQVLGELVVDGRQFLALDLLDRDRIVVGVRHFLAAAVLGDVRDRGRGARAGLLALDRLGELGVERARETVDLPILARQVRQGLALSFVTSGRP
jgi:hypothetical protein